MYKEIDKSISNKRDAIISMSFMPLSFLKPNEPLFRHWNKLPKKMTDRFKDLKSDDIKDDNWHLRNK